MSAVKKRLSIIDSIIDPRQSKILEIGALDAPTFHKSEFHVEYVDYATTQQLNENSKGNPRYALDRLVEVDHVVSERSYRETIDAKFDLIIANHVVEHVADPIEWLFDLGHLLTRDGMIFLSVPDRRFTFDIVRRESNLIDLLRPHVTRQRKPDFLNILDHFWHHKQIRTKDVLEGRSEELSRKMRYSPKDAWNVALAASKRPYADVHCHVFTHESFKELFMLLRDFGFLPFASMETWSTEHGHNEFHVVLGRFEPESLTDTGT